MTNEEIWYTDEWARLAQLVDLRIEDVFGELRPTYDEPASGRFADTARKVYRHLATQGFDYELSPVSFSLGRRYEQRIRMPEQLATGARKANCVELALILAGYCLVARLRPLLVASDDHVVVAIWLGGDVDSLGHGPEPLTLDEDDDFLDQGILRAGRGDLARQALLARVDVTGTSTPAGSAFLVVEPVALAAYLGRGPVPFAMACAQGSQHLTRMRLQGLVDVAFLLNRHGDRRRENFRLRSHQLEGLALRAFRGALGDLARSGEAIRPRPVWDRVALRSVRGELPARPATEAEWRVDWLAENLGHALEAAAFVQDWLPGRTPRQLRRAADATLAASARSGVRTDTPSARRDLDSFAEVVLYHAKKDGRGAKRALVEFVARLAVISGSAKDGHDAGRALRDDPRFREWRGRLVDEGEVNAIIDAVLAPSRAGPWRLVLNLDSPHGAWPEEIAAWLVDAAGEPFEDEPHRERCEPRRGARVSESDVADAIRRTFHWAEYKGFEDLIEEIDLAVPTGLLDGENGQPWRPEELEVEQMLAEDYHVVVRWGRRLSAGTKLRPVRKRYRKIMRLPADERLLWLTPDECATQLERGVLDVAVGLSAVPAGGVANLLAEVLPRTPIVLWPDPEREHLADGDLLWAKARQELADTLDEQVPERLAEAYRKRRRRVAPDPGPPLALLRAVWEDDPWLAFCRRVNPAS